MKKILCLLAVFALFISISACGTVPAPAASKKSPVPTENAEALPEASSASPEVKPYDKEQIAALMEKSPIMQTLEGEDAKTETWEEFEEYNRVIRDMGFKEFDAGYRRPSDEDIIRIGLVDYYEAMGPEFKMEELKSNGEVFRLDFDYTDFDDQKYEQEGTPGKLVDGWIILGTKGSGPDNISGFANEDFDFADSLNHSELFPEIFSDGYRELVDYSFYNLDKEELPTVFVQCTAIYYPDSGNLYNIINIFNENLLDFNVMQPDLLYAKRDDAINFGQNNP